MEENISFSYVSNREMIRFSPSLRTSGSFGGWRCRYRHVFIKAIESRLAVGGRGGCSAKPAMQSSKELWICNQTIALFIRKI